jgi:hypothetical protein
MTGSDRPQRTVRMPGIIASSGATPDRTELLQDDHGRRYLKSWLAIRLTVGLLGLLMPVLLIDGDIVVLAGEPSARGSLSAYYHSGMRDVFVGILCVVGVFLITYKLSERDWDNGLTIIAGIAAVGVALFPTWTDRGQSLTPWQERLTEPTAARIHLAAAAVFTLSLAIVSLRFGHRDAQRAHRRYAFANRACGVVMIAAVVALVLLKWIWSVDEVGGYTLLLIVELVCTVAFGLSWILKGNELRQAIRAEEPKAARRPAAPAGLPAPA